MQAEHRREVEAKIILPSCSILEDVREKLSQLGALREGEVFEKDTYFQHPCRDFRETDEALRVRVAYRPGEGEAVRVTYKGAKRVRGVAKSREEIELGIVGGEEEAVALFERLGFKRVAVVEKKREYYVLGATTVSLDRVERLGCFVEIESKRGRVEDVEETLKLLGLEGYGHTTLSYLELLLSLEEGRNGES